MVDVTAPVSTMTSQEALGFSMFLNRYKNQKAKASWASCKMKSRTPYPSAKCLHDCRSHIFSTLIVAAKKLGSRNRLKHLQRPNGWEASAQVRDCSLRVRSCPIPRSSQSLWPGAGCDPHRFVFPLTQNPKAEAFKVPIKIFHWKFSLWSRCRESTGRTKLWPSPKYSCGNCDGMGKGLCTAMMTMGILTPKHRGGALLQAESPVPPSMSVLPPQS